MFWNISLSKGNQCLYKWNYFLRYLKKTVSSKTLCKVFPWGWDIDNLGTVRFIKPYWNPVYKSTGSR